MMLDKMNVKEAARRWNVTERRVTELCKEGKIEGAYKEGRSWVLPMIAEKPVDYRVKSGKYTKSNKHFKLPLPIGISDYRMASTQFYYVDKTLLIKDLIDEVSHISLFTRPRRFGKTLNMDMLRVFFEKSKEDTSIYFKGKKIWSCGKKYQQHQGKYPVMFLTFKDIKYQTWENTFDALKTVIAKEVKRHSELLSSDKIDYYDKKQIEKIISKNVNEVELSNVLLDLSEMLYKHYGIGPVLIVDEYDVPIQQGYMMQYYEKVILFMRNLFSAALKDNKYISFGFLTGILRVSKESIFSGLNNLHVHSVLEHRYSQYFGFTSEEIKTMTYYFEVPEKYDELCEWYDGYRFGKTDIFNPWSVLNYFYYECQPQTYWQATGSNDIIREIIQSANKEIYEKLIQLMNGEKIKTYIDTSVIYPHIKNNPSTIFSFLLVAGYLKIFDSPSYLNDICEVSLPNKEIAYVYHKEILLELQNMIPQSLGIEIQHAIVMKDCEGLKSLIQTLLMTSVSSFDYAKETFYHGLMLGLCALVKGYFVTSNKESGDGRYDISLKPIYSYLPGILIELKSEKQCSKETLKKLAKKALEQIHLKQYDTQMRMEGVSFIYKYGVAFSGKNVEIEMEC